MVVLVVSVGVGVAMSRGGGRMSRVVRRWRVTSWSLGAAGAIAMVTAAAAMATVPVAMVVFSVPTIIPMPRLRGVVPTWVSPPFRGVGVVPTWVPPLF